MKEHVASVNEVERSVFEFVHDNVVYTHLQILKVQRVQKPRVDVRRYDSPSRADAST